MVQESAESLLTVINDILDFSKIEAGKLELDEVDFHLRDTLDKSSKPSRCGPTKRAWTWHAGWMTKYLRSFAAIPHGCDR